MGRETVWDAGVGEVERTRGSAQGVLGRHGVAGDAELLIAAVQASNPAQLETASRQGENFAEKAKLDWSEVAEVAGAQILDATVRGVESVVYSALDQGGALYKGTYELSRPERTHVSERSAFRESEIGQMLAAQDEKMAAVQDSGRTAALDEREAQLARRERALREQQAEIDRAKAATPDTLAVNPQTGTSAATPTPAPPVETQAAPSPAAPGPDTNATTPPAPSTQNPPAADGSSDDGGAAALRPSWLPGDFDAQSAKDAAEFATVVPEDHRPALLAYEQATKNRKTVRRALGEDVPAGDED